MKVAIVGAGGLVGSELARQLSTQHDVLALSHRDLDVTDNETVHRLMLKEQPALIINCAVLGVDSCEANPSLAWSVNAGGAENLAKAGAAVNAQVVQLSSNYVFDGRRSNTSSYTSDDLPNPINIYGETKLAGERAVSAANQRSFIVRTSWVFGPGKENFFSAAPRLLRESKKVQAITDVFANSTYVPDLAARILEIVSLGRYATYHVVNSGLCSYYEFALEAARLIGKSDTDLKQLIAPKCLSDLRLQAARPKHTPLECRISAELGLAPLPDWRAALAEYIQELSALP